MCRRVTSLEPPDPLRNLPLLTYAENTKFILLCTPEEQAKHMHGNYYICKGTKYTIVTYAFGSTYKHIEVKANVSMYLYRNCIVLHEGELQCRPRIR